ncbi:MAG TPA: hypothetical protein VFZ57_07695 [Thermoanaerobaculia bacterium]|nr:hypothetical protein [Thermoanaerobaculia bacterium]
MAPTLDAAARAAILDFVRPLSVGLDGVTNFGFVEKRIRISDFLESEEGAGSSGVAGADPARLFLLAAFAGLPSARRITPDSREELLLRSLRIPFEEISSLVSSLKRIEADPQSPEEKIVHDAMLLESVGAYGVTQLLVAGARDRMTLAEMAREIAEKMAAARFATPAGRRLAADRVAFAKLFASKLAEEAGEFASVAPR